MAKIAIVSDIHLGTRQYGLKERSQDFLAAFSDVASKVVAKHPDALIIGGDLFDSPRPDAASVLSAMKSVAVVRKAGIPVYGIDGNHDMSGGNWLRVAGIEPLDHLRSVEIGGRRIRGVHYLGGRDLISTLSMLADSGEKCDVLTMHFALHEMNGGGTADTGVAELSPILDKMGVKCVLMGHVHIPSARMFNGIMFVNPGSTELKSSNEPRDKYFFMVDLDDYSCREVPVKTREIVDVEIASEEKLVEFQNMLRKEAAAGGDRALYNVIADADMEDVFKRLSQSVKETGAVARIVICARQDRDVAPMVDRQEGMSTLESAIEARFPADSQEAKLVGAFLRSPDSASIHMIVERFMKGEAV